MYHYVRPTTDRPPQYYHLHLEDFQRQLEYFESEFGFVDRSEFLRVMRGGGSTVPSGVVLTFDDGLRDHYEYAFQELRDRDLWGIFYVPTGQYTSSSILNVHRVHRLLGLFGGDDLLDHLTDLVNERMIPGVERQEFRNETYHRQQNDDSTTAVKRILNYYLSPEYRAEVINQIEQRLSVPALAVEDLYMTKKELRHLHSSGMIIGSHSQSHPVLSMLSSDEQRAEILESFEWLERNVGTLDIRTFCYPYGESYSFDEETTQILDAADCRFAFSVESRDIEPTDIETRRLELPRYDCNEYPYGESRGGVGLDNEDQ